MLAQADALARRNRPAQVAAAGGTPADLLVADCMRSEVPFATPDLPAIELARPMADSLHCVPVLDEGRVLAGLVTQSDLVAALHQMALSAAAQAAPGHDSRLAA